MSLLVQDRTWRGGEPLDSVTTENAFVGFEFLPGRSDV
jgi:hypothetical protein